MIPICYEFAPGATARDISERNSDMGLRINDTVPNLTVTTDQGTFALHDWIGDSWAILFSHPKDFTPVCTTELGYMAKFHVLCHPTTI